MAGLMDGKRDDILMREVIFAEVMRGLLEMGLNTPSVSSVVLTIHWFVAVKCPSSPSSSVPLGVRSHVAVLDLKIEEEKGFQVKITLRKSKQLDRPLYLTYALNGYLELGKGVHHLFFWLSRVLPAIEGLFNLPPGALWTAILGSGLERAFLASVVTAPTGYQYSSHSPRIGALNELVNLKFSLVWLIHRLNWSTEAMFQVYYYSRIVSTTASGFLFAHLQHTGYRVAVLSFFFMSVYSIYAHKYLRKSNELTLMRCQV